MVGVYQSIRVSGELNREKVESVKTELLECEIVPDCIVLGGPSKSNQAWAQQPTWFWAREKAGGEGGGRRGRSH